MKFETLLWSGTGALLAGGITAPALAADLAVEVEIPQLNVAEYHRPYVAIWVERADKSVAANLAVWYQQGKGGPEGQGTKWLKDMRQWWRRSGRELSFPVDGVTGATRPVGKHSVSFSDRAAPLGPLPAGDYTLLIEAAREVGGREVLSIPFQWPPKQAGEASALGQHELGKVTVSLKP